MGSVRGMVINHTHTMTMFNGIDGGSDDDPGALGTAPCEAIASNVVTVGPSLGPADPALEEGS